MPPYQKKTGDAEIGGRIAMYRNRAGLSRSELAAEIGVTYASISHFETGYRMPTAKNQHLIARALGVSLDELFGDSEDDPFDDSLKNSEDALVSARPAFARLSFDESVDAAVNAIRNVPHVKRLDALIEVQQTIMRELTATAPPRTGWITKLEPNEVFVYGTSDRAGHSAGAARTALEKFGAKVGEVGYVGQTYGIVTTEGWNRLVDEVETFLGFADQHPALRFLLTPIGTGTAGYHADQIAPLFLGSPGNIELPEEFQLV